MEENDIYSLCPESKYITQSLKILEDEIFYQRVKDWGIYLKYFDEILAIEKDYGIDEKALKKWHVLLQKYFQKQPDEDLVREFVLAIGLTEEIAEEIKENIRVMKENKQIIEIIERLYENFDSLVG